MNRVEIDQKIEQYGLGFDLLSAALAGIPKQAWSFRLAPGEWNVHEIIVHMADSESMSALRARKLIAEPGSALMGYAEAQWADSLDYMGQDVELALEIIRLARKSTYDLLKRQPEEVFTHSVLHPEYPEEPYTFEQWLKIYARHIPDHIEQMKQNHLAWLDRHK